MESRLLKRRFDSGVRLHKRGRRLNWFVYAQASRFLGDHRAPDPYPAQFVAYCEQIQQTPKRAARLVRAYRFWLHLYLLYLDPPPGIVLVAEQHPRHLRRALSLTHFEAVRETYALQSKMNGPAQVLETLRVAAAEKTPVRVLRAELQNEVDAEQGVLFHEWDRRAAWFRNNAANLPEKGQRRLRLFLDWWEDWKRLN